MRDTGIVKIHNKEYHTVAKRVNDLRGDHPDWSIVTSLISNEVEIVVMRAEIQNEEGRVIGTGYAEENRNNGQINRTSALENCETSAIGRALSACGYAGTEYASANEVQNAVGQQQRGEDTRPITYTDEQRARYHKLFRADDALAFFLFVKSLDEQAQIDLHNTFHHGEKTKMKEQAKELGRKGSVMLAALTNAINEDKGLTILENIEGCDDETLALLNARLTTDQKTVLNDARNAA